LKLLEINNANKRKIYASLLFLQKPFDIDITHLGLFLEGMEKDADNSRKERRRE